MCWQCSHLGGLYMSSGDNSVEKQKGHANWAGTALASQMLTFVRPPFCRLLRWFADEQQLWWIAHRCGSLEVIIKADSLPVALCLWDNKTWQERDFLQYGISLSVLGEVINYGKLRHNSFLSPPTWICNWKHLFRLHQPNLLIVVTQLENYFS